MTIFYLKERARNCLIEIHKKLYEKQYEKVLSLLEPNLLGLTKKGFGKDGDGTYVLPVDLIKNSNEFKLLSFGISNDISFEKEFSSVYPDIDIYAFDPTIKTLPEPNTKISFLEIGLAGKDNSGRMLFTLDAILDKLNLARSNKFILKIDIEGWEWGFLSKFDFTKIQVPIIAIELHFLPLTSKKETLLLPIYFKRKYGILKRILKLFYIHHVHANNYQYINFKKFRFPTYLELTLVNKKCFVDEIRKEIQNLNKPTLGDKEDHQYPFGV